MAPQKKTFKKAWDLDTQTVTLTDGDRETVYRLADLSDELRLTLALHGLVQKLADSAAKEAGTPVEEKWAAIDATWDALAAGEWSRKREGQGTLLLRALCEVYPNRAKDDLKAWLDARTPAERTALSLNPRIKSVLDALQAERTTAIDTDALLDDLE